MSAESPWVARLSGLALVAVIAGMQLLCVALAWWAHTTGNGWLIPAELLCIALAFWLAGMVRRCWSALVGMWRGA